MLEPYNRGSQLIMKRKLISYDLFNTLQERSLSTVEQELIEAEDVLAAALDVDGLELLTFSESDVKIGRAHV